MSIKRVLAQAAVTDLDRAIQWYANLFDFKPEAPADERLGRMAAR